MHGGLKAPSPDRVTAASYSHRFRMRQEVGENLKGICSGIFENVILEFTHKSCEET